MARRKPSLKRSAKSRKKRSVVAYPAVVFLLLCAGVLLTIWTFKALADDIVVTAEVAARPVTGPAVITSPSDGDHFSSIPVTVSGTCPSDGSGGYVKVYRNSVFSGVALCDSSNNFSLSSDLFTGSNIISAQIYNTTNDSGPASTPITVYYDTAQPPIQTSPNGSSNASSPATPTFVISSNFRYVGYYVGQRTEWDFNIAGGTPAYAVSVDWGDSTNNVYSYKDVGDFTVDHIYKAPGKLKNHSYVITISGSDSEGRQSRLQLFVIINNRTVSPVAASIIGATCNASGINFSSLSCFVRTKDLLKFIWPAYGVVFLMSLSYVLGEREELIVLGKKGLLLRRHR